MTKQALNLSEIKAHPALTKKPRLLGPASVAELVIENTSGGKKYICCLTAFAKVIEVFPGWGYTISSPSDMVSACQPYLLFPFADAKESP